MNLLALLGAAAACQDFCNLLFDDPLRAASLLNITLTRGELSQLRTTFSEEDRDELCGHLGKIAVMICKHPPCPYVPVIPGKEDFCKEVAA